MISSRACFPQTAISGPHHLKAQAISRSHCIKISHQEIQLAVSQGLHFISNTHAVGRRHDSAAGASSDTKFLFCGRRLIAGRRRSAARRRLVMQQRRDACAKLEFNLETNGETLSILGNPHVHG